MKTEIHAGQVAPGMTRYKVSEPHNHTILRLGDIVVMVEDPGLNNWLLRLSDMRLCPLTGESAQYVHMWETDEAP